MNEGATKHDSQPDSDSAHAPADARAAFPIVGLGASAGGLEAFKAFFDHMSSDSGMAFVLVTHLSPTHKSQLIELLSPHTQMNVHEAQHGIPVEPNHVYIIAPDTTLTIHDCILRVTKPAPPPGQRTPIDDFFCSLAQDQGCHAVGIVLSGTGSDGTLGVKAIKEHGGMVITQAEDSAHYGDMPRNAHAGDGDYVLSVEDMPTRLLEHAAHVAENRDECQTDGLRKDQRKVLQQILALLHSRTGYDFSGYKENTIVRRIDRRMQVNRSESPAAYLEYLRSSPDEFKLLFDDILIGVTYFMRDTVVFKQLEDTAVKQICSGKTHKDTIRVWVPGCATGEEPYSLGILFLEGVEYAACKAQVQIFATDLDEKALSVARAGRYLTRVARDLSEPRLNRFFHKYDGGYEVDNRLHELCVFSKHDLLTDPPLSKLDLISCRNVLIYLDQSLQRRLIPLFHYALRPGGFLLLGTVETVAGFDNLFEPVDHKHRIFRRRDVGTPRLEFPTVGPSHKDEDRSRPRRREIDVDRQIERYLLERYAPPCVVVNRRLEVVHFSRGTGRYLESPPGAPDTHLLSMARHGLGVHLRAIVDEVIKNAKATVREDVHVKGSGGYQTLTLRARPIMRNGETVEFVGVIFEPAETRPQTALTPAERPRTDDKQSVVQQLEEELRNTQRELQATIEDLETSNQKLRSSNEELMSTNEELQSTAEELDTSKEELQSSNEELIFANEQLRSNVDELTRANTDIKNLLENAQIAMMFLDAELRVKSFTPKMRDLYHLRTIDTGRPIGDIRAKYDHHELEAYVASVQRDSATVERQVHTDERRYLMRILPYRTLQNRIEGVVLTFVDVTSLERAREEVLQLTRAQERHASELEAILAMLPVGITVCSDPKGRTARLNREAARLMDVTEDVNTDGKDEEGRALFTIPRGSDVLPQKVAPIQRAMTTGTIVEAEVMTIARGDGSKLDVETTAWPVFDEQGQVTGAIGMFIDLSERKREFELHAAQQATIVRLGIYALSENDVGKVLRRMVTSVTEALGAARAAVWRLDETRGQLVLEVSTGQEGELAHEAQLNVDVNIPVGYTLDSGQPVTIENIAEQDFPLPMYRDQAGMVCSMSVAIKAGDQSYGVLSVHDRERRQFLPYETNFLQSVADLTGAVIVRKQIEIGHGQAQRRQAFAEADERMRQAERLASLGTLAAGIAHEVNNPLNSILMNAELGLISLKSADSEKKLTRLLSTIIKEAQRGGSVTRNVLQFSKADRYTPKGQANVNDVVERAREHVASVLHKFNAKLDLELDQTLPRLELNQIAMEQAMVNLISNAAQSGASRIVVGADRSGRHVRIVVSDDGRGIAPNELEHIFDPFYTTRRSQGGSGLGLSLVHRIVADHNGTVEAHSAPGQGTRFVVCLPLPAELA